ncbi:hypothetical protein [Tahibacter harae]|uniref:Uncharacterized protein n=1 Tax=Tahibacter harae TaxID=2963937 RepID=A0ABT1QV85_9GAMM|nr:hypothetical protein [Tahibacter harae]MCQ4166191.1 hypothetical protein [Tahibacter harae]
MKPRSAPWRGSGFRGARTRASLAAVLGMALAFAAAATVAAPLDEAAATNRLLQQLKRSAPYRVHGDCLSLLVEESEPAFFGIAVHEKHGDGCPGDPATAPVLDRFRVDVATGAMRRYDVVEDRYAEWAPDMAR